MDHRVFINYRGEDSYSYGALLYTELARQFGEEQVFLDCVSIPAGADFAEELLGQVRSASVLLAVIGARWLTATDPTGARRIDDPADWIRRELAEAFAAGVRVIPILTEQTEIPAEAELPADIAALRRCQYRRLRHHDPTADLARIVADLTKLDPALVRLTGDDSVPTEPSVRNDVSGTVIGPAIQAGSIGQVNNVGRDQHLHYVDGVHDQRRVTAGVVVRECPYPGLSAFGQEQAQWFFGRSTLVAELIARLDKRLRTGGLQLVVAPSGAGKSSLLRAGLLPKLQQAGLPGSDRWPMLVFTPTSDPVGALAARLASLAGDGVVTAAELVADPPRCLSVLAPHGRVVVVVDQFEELFTLCTDDRHRRTFIDLLIQIADNRAGLVVVGLRADFYAACVGYPSLRAALQDAQLVVGPMSDQELREAIRYPARTVGLDIEEGLVELLLRDLGTTATTTGAGYEAGRLPLLAHALRVSWQQRHGSTLTVRGYQDTGGIQHAIATTADQVYASLDDEGQQVARSLFLRLVKVGDGTEDIRRRLSHTELMATGADPARVAAVVDAFTQARLLTQQQDTVEITHEALLRNWPRLRGWIDTDREWLRARQQLADDARTWERAGRDSSLLYRGNRLASLRERATDAPAGAADLEPVPATFLAASWRQERRGVRLRRLAVAVLAALLVVALGGVGVAAWQGRIAAQQRDTAASRAAGQAADRLRSTDPALAMQLALAARHVADTPEARTSVFNSALAPYDTLLTGHTGTVGRLTYSPDRRVLASSSNDRTVRLWDLADPHHPRAAAVLDKNVFDTNTKTAPGDVAFSPDGRLLAAGNTATGQQPGTAPVLWDITNLDKPAAVATLDGAGGALTFSPDGRRLAAIAPSALTLWDLTDPGHPARSATLPIDTTTIMSSSFSSDGHTLAAAIGPPVGTENGSFLVQLWNVTDAHHPTPAATLPDTHAFAVAFSPSSPLLAVGGSNVGTHLWDTTNPAQPVQIDTKLTVLGADTTVAALAFSQDGRNLAMGADDRDGDHVEVDDVSDPRMPHVTARYSMPTLITSVAFGDDHQDVFASGAENAIRLWHPAPAATMPDINDVAAEKVKYTGFTPDSRILALPTELDDGKIQTVLDGQEFQLWRISAADDASPAGRLTTASFGAQLVAVDNDTLLEASPNQPVRLWDVSDPDRPHPGATLNNLRPSRYGGTGDVATTGQLAAVNGDDGLVHLWDLTKPQAPAALGTVPQTDNFLGTNLGDDGHTLYVIDAAGTIHVWDITDPRRPAEVSQITTGGGLINTLAGQIDHAPGIRSVFALKTTTLSPGAIQLWDLTDIRHPVRADTPPLVAHTFLTSPDGHTLALTTGNTVELWDITDIRHPVKTAGRPAVAQTQLAFSPDSRTLASTASFSIVADHDTTSEIHLWNVTDPGNPVDIGIPAVPGSVASLNFSPDGANLLIASNGFEELSFGGGARLLNTDIDQLTQRLCDLAGSPLAPDQWRQHFPGTPVTPPCA